MNYKMNSYRSKLTNFISKSLLENITPEEFAEQICEGISNYIESDEREDAVGFDNSNYDKYNEQIDILKALQEEIKYQIGMINAEVRRLKRDY